MSSDPARNITDVYALSPMQEGMLFHTLLQPTSGIYLMQNRYRIQGEVDEAAFRAAWEQVVARHSVLRTSFVYKSQKRPLQVVHERVELPFQLYDYRHLPPEERKRQLDAELERELAAGLPFGKAPLTRFRLIRWDEGVYEFVHSFHHILLDEWCTSVLMMDFLAHYTALVERRPLKQPPAPPYRAYIDWLGRQDANAAERFFRGYLRGFSGATPLGLEYDPRDAEGVGSSAGSAAESESASEVTVADVLDRLPVRATERLTALVQKHRLTLNTLVQGAWALVLSRYSGERDVVFGVTVAGRPPELPGVESIVGLFINTLPLRVDVTPEQKLVPWLGELLGQNLRLRQYEYAPLVEVQRWSEIERGQSLFDSLFVFESAPIDPVLRENRFVFELQQARDRVHTNYPVTVMAWPDTELGLKITYDTRRVDAGSATRLLGQLRTVLEQMAERPDARLGELSLANHTERQRAIHLWNGRRAADAALANGDRASTRDRGDSLPRLFEARVAESPSAAAVASGGRVISYAGLNALANRVAHALLEAGVGPESRVLVMDERGIELIALLLGVFKAGAAYVPVEPGYPSERVASIERLAEPRVILTRRRYQPFWDQLAAEQGSARTPRLCFEDILAGEFSDENPSERGGPMNLAYMMFTSGSTGTPKGVMIERRGMLNNMLTKLPLFELGPNDVIAQTAPLSFDIAVWQLFTALLVGGRVEVITSDVAGDPARLLAHVERAGVSVLEVVPGVLQGLLDAAEQAPERPVLARLRHVLPTGEALPVALARAWLEAYPRIPLSNAYGPAECSDDVAIHRIVEPPAPGELRVPIGRAIERLELYNLDASGNVLPARVTGELYVGGVGVGRGYARDPRRTAEVFLPNPFSAEPGARLYRTGDRVRYRADGTLEFVERRDHQVKIRGLRIELGEIEARLARHPGLAEVAVIVREDRPGQRRLVAYCVPRGELLGAPALQAWLASSLPQYMIPHQFVTLRELPRTTNGKLDRRALPAPELGSARAKAAPRTAAEQLLADIWREVLGVAEVGAEDGFFELGGHSLLLTQVLAKVRRTFGIEPMLRALFEAPTLADQARVIEAARAAAAAGTSIDAAPPLVAASSEGPLAPSFAQERLWFMAQLEPTAASYNLPAAVRLHGALDVERLAQSLDALMERHAVLRARFREHAGRPVLGIAPSEGLPLARVELPAGAAALDPDAMIRERLEAFAALPFDLQTGPLARALLIRVSDAEHVLGVVLHHIVSDGWSMQLLVRDLAELYAALLEQRPATLPTLPVQYSDYARWQRAWLEGGVLERQLEFWRRRLAGEPPVLSLPIDHPRPSAASYRGARYAFTCPAALASGLVALSRRERVTPFMVGLAVFQILLWRHAAQPRIWVGSPVANRGRAEVQDLVGLFVNTLVLRADLSGAPKFTELVARVRDEVLDAQVHQDLPFERLVQALAPARDLSQTPLFQVMFTLQELAREVSALPGVRMGSIEIDPGTSQFELSLDLALDTAGEQPELTGSFEYSTDLFERATVERFALHFVELLEAIVSAPERRITELPLVPHADGELLGAAPRGAVSQASVGSSIDAPADVLSSFHAHVRQRPEAIAVTGFGVTLSYAELARRAARLAAHLRSLGVGPEVRVSLFLPRSADLIVAVLGVLEAGGAYVCVDPDYPAERVHYLLSDARAAVVVTTAALAPRLDVVDARVVCMDAGALASSAGGAEREPLLAPPPHPAQLAYVNYTSGSTGRPKGVLVTHGALRDVWSAWQQSYLAEVGPARLMQLASPSFDVFAADWVRALCSGGTLVFCPTELVAAPAELVAWMRRESVNVADIVPAVARPLSSHLVQSGERLEFLRVLIVGSDTWEMREWRALQRCLTPGTRLLSAYGVTEATIDSACFDGSGSEALRPEQAVPVGRALDGTRLYVVDAELLPLPIGVAGELCIAGSGVARGYSERPGLTAERFVPDPFSTEPGARLYRTGDRARFDASGNLQFLGRADRQIKLRGVRIELGEIEARLAAHPNVSSVAVVLREDDGLRRLVAYAVLREAAGVAPRELTEWLARELPDVMVPSAVVLLEAMPLTPHGKLDRRALPAPERPAAAEPSLPVTAVERTLAEIWSQVLGRDGVGTEDNFFELGGDSIQSLQVVARARQRGLALSARQLFQHQTIAELARVVEATGVTGGPEQGLVTGPAPLTPVQRWFFALPLPRREHWNMALLLTVREALDVAALGAAVGALVRHHDALRLRYTETTNGWQQTHAAEPWPAALTTEDLSALPESAQPTVLEARAARWQASAALGAGPLFRAVLFELGSGRSRLLLVAHHLVVDGVSWRIVLEDLEAAYDQARRGEPIELPAKTSSFKLWSERLARLAADHTLEADAEHWLALPWQRVTPIPVDEPSGSRAEAHMLELTASLDASETRALLAALADASAPRIEELLLAALAVACARWLEREVVAIDVEGHGRDLLDDVTVPGEPELDVSRTVGWFTNVYPVVFELEPEGGVPVALRTVREAVRRIPRRGAAFGVVRELGEGACAERLRALAAPEIAFNYLGQWDQTLGEGARFTVAPESPGPEHDPESPLAYEVEIDAAIYSGELQTTFRYSTARLERARTERLIELFQASLRDVIAEFGPREPASYRPSDFPDVDLGTDELDALLKRLSA